MNRAEFWSNLIRLSARLVPDAPESWVQAIRAELYVMPSSEQSRYAISSLRGLLTIGVTTCARRWGGHASVLAFAALAGLGVAAIDMASQTRLPLLLGLILGSATTGLTAPRVSRVSGFILGMSFPAFAALMGARAQYPTDLNHAWIPLLPAIALSSMFGWLRIRYHPAVAA